MVFMTMPVDVMRVVVMFVMAIVVKVLFVAIIAYVCYTLDAKMNNTQQQKTTMTKQEQNQINIVFNICVDGSDGSVWSCILTLLFCSGVCC